jgi:hypothetical protein
MERGDGAIPFRATNIAAAAGTPTSASTAVFLFFPLLMKYFLISLAVCHLGIKILWNQGILLLVFSVDAVTQFINRLIHLVVWGKRRLNSLLGTGKEHCYFFD